MNYRKLLIALTQTSVVPVILVILGVPGVVVARSQMDVRLISTVIHEVIVSEWSPGVPPVLTIASAVSPRQVMAVIAITGGVLGVHVVAQALHGVGVSNVGKAESVAKLRGVGEVGAVVLALGPVHHQGVGAHVGPAPALRAPVGRGRAGGEVRNRLRDQADLLISRGLPGDQS